MSLEARVKYLKEVLGISRVIMPLDRILENSPEIKSKEKLEESESFSLAMKTENKESSYLFITQEKDISIEEMQLLEKIILALKIPFQKVDIACLQSSFENKFQFFQYLNTKKYKHVFVLGELFMSVIGFKKRNDLIEINKVKIYSAHSPKELIRNPELKKSDWSFFKSIMQKLSIIFFVFFTSFYASVSHADCTLEINIEGAIGPATADYLQRSFKKAEELNCSSFLALINTPGGSLDSTRIIVEKILNSPRPFLCLVAPQGGHAGSAGAIILQACHVNGALKATNIGAATPVVATGQELPQDMRNKMVNDTVSWLEGITKLRDRNMDFSKKIVSEAKAVSSEEAFKIKAIDILAEDIKDFLEQAKKRTYKTTQNEKKEVVVGEIKIFKPDTKFQVLQIFSNPQISYLIFMGSLALLYFEFTNPGTIVPGVIGAIGLVLSLINFHMLDVSWAGLVLIVLGILFMIAEAYVPSFGALGIGGIVSFILGGIFLFDATETGYTLPLMTIIPTAIVLGGTMLAIGYLMLKTRAVRVRTGSEEMIGLTSKVKNLTSSRSGNVKIFGELWQFDSVEDLVLGDEIEVLEVQGLKLKVKKRR